MEIVRKLPFASIPGWHPIAQLFVSSAAFRQERFPATAKLQSDPESVLQRPYDWTLWDQVLAALRESMASLSLTEAQQAMMHSAATQRTVRFVITGQQPGIFSGPLYTLLKVWTTVVAARQLQERFPAYHFIPVFWVDDNDSDWEEVSTVWSYDEEFRLHKLQMDWEPHPARAPVSEGVFGQQARNTLRRFYHCLPHMEERKAALRILEPLYRYRTPFLEAFLQEMQWILGDTGILFLRASVLRRRGLLATVLIKELEHPERIRRIIETHQQWLQRWNVTLQAEPKAFNLFVLHNGERRSLQWDGEFAFLNGQRFTIDQLLALAKTQPERLTTTVLSRPLVQDAILPTVLSVLGPSELAYWAELREVFEDYGIPMSAVQLRYSVTLLEPKARRSLRKLPLSYESLLQRYEDVEAQLLQTTDWQQYEQQLVEAEQAIRHTMEPIQQAAAEIDPGLQATADKATTAMIKQLEILRAKMRRAYKFRLEVQLSHLQKAHRYFYPEMQLQERRITPWYFIARFGRHRLLQALQLLQFEDSQAGHFLVEL